MISTGIIGTPRHLAKQRQQDAGKDVAAARPASSEDRSAGARHMRRVNRITSRLQCEVRFDRTAEIERAAVEQWPAAVLTLARA
jgi:hypothetical protein